MSENGKAATVVADWDDLCDGNDRLDVLMRLKERDPGFRCTMFAIPARCSDDLLKRYDNVKGWVQLAVHGFRHSRHEAMGWLQDEAEAKLEMALEIYQFARVFKAPNWQMTDDVYAACIARGFSVADHWENSQIIPPSLSRYIYNIKLREDPYTRMHGHIQPTFWDKGLEGDYEKWCSPEVGSNYLFVSDACTTPTPMVF